VLARVRTLVGALLRRRRWEDELADELQSHVEHRSADLIRQGVAPANAVRQARLELGPRDAHRDAARAAFGLRGFDELHQDLRYAIRALVRSPGFALVAVVSLGLGVGINTIVFSVTNALVLRPLPVVAPDQLAFLQTSFGPTLSYPNYRDLRDRNVTFTDLSAYRFARMGLQTEHGTDRIWGYLATGNYFELLGVRPVLGRFFTADEDRVPGGSPLAVLTHASWQSRFGGDPAIIGRTVRINGLGFTVIGVAPPGFTGTEVLYRPEVWVPMMMQPQIEGWSWLEVRETYNAMVIGRRKPTVTSTQAEADLNRILASLAREFPSSSGGLSARAVRPGLVGDTGRRTATAFMGGVMLLAGLVLVAACANLAGLLSARTADRAREIALRVAIGASRSRVLRQLSTETVTLSLGAGAVGWVLARLALRGLSRWQVTTGLPLEVSVEPDWRIFGFALATSVAVGLACGLVAARRAWQVDLNSTLKGVPASSRVRRRWPVRDIALAGQMMLACVILTAGAASIRGLLRAHTMPLGYVPRGLAVAAVDLSLAQLKPDDGRAVQRRTLEAIATLPGAVKVAYANSIPLSPDQSSTVTFSDQAVDFSASRAMRASYYEVSPSYFETVGTRLLAGRDFTWHDDAAAPLVAIVNQTFAHRLFGAGEAVGRRFRYAKGQPTVEIVGVVEDGKYQALTEDPTPALFRPSGQSYNSSTVFLVRSSSSEAAMAGQIRQAITALDSSLPVYSVGSALDLAGFAFIPTRLAAAALSAFGALAVMLALTGIYGMSAYVVSRSVREIGVRTALGAQPMQVLRFVFGRTAMVLGVGSLVGLALAILTGRALANVVYQASAAEPVVLAAAALSMLAVGLAAAVVPARRALSVGPLRALRTD